MIFKRKQRKERKKGFGFDVADFFVTIGEIFYYLFRAIFRFFD